MRDRARRPLASALALLAAPLLAAGIAPARSAGDEPWTRHPGYVSGAELAALADERGELVEVSVTGPLLRLVAASVRAQDKELAATIAALAAVSAVVVTVDRDATSRLAAVERALLGRLEAGGWDAVARIRDGSSRITVWVLPRDDRIEGLTVLVRDGRDVVFTNIAGRVDPEMLQALAARLDLPGLDRFVLQDVQRESRDEPGDR